MALKKGSICCLFVRKPEVSKYCAELMPLLLGYLSSLNDAKIGHVTKAFYALENFLENLGEANWSTERNVAPFLKRRCLFLRLLFCHLDLFLGQGKISSPTFRR